MVEKVFFWNFKRESNWKPAISKGQENETIVANPSDVCVSCSEFLYACRVILNRSLKDTTIQPVPLYSSTDDDTSQQVAAQLYFGPGFEHRLEMELNE